MRCSVPLAARAQIRRGLDDHILTRQMLGQAADVAHRLGAGSSVLRPRLCGLRLRLDRRARDILEPKRQLSRRRRRTAPSARHTASAAASPAWPAACRSRRAARGPSRSGCRARVARERRRTPWAKSTEPRRRFATLSTLGAALYSAGIGDRAGADLGPVHAGEQQPELRRVQRDRPVAHRRPSERTALQPLGDQAQPGPVPDEQFQTVRALRTEDENVAGERVAGNACMTKAASESMPLRKSTGLEATMIRSPGRGGTPRITPAARGAPAPSGVHRRRPHPAPAREPGRAQSRSPLKEQRTPGARAALPVQKRRRHCSKSGRTLPRIDPTAWHPPPAAARPAAGPGSGYDAAPRRRSVLLAQGSPSGSGPSRLPSIAAAAQAR